MRQNLLVEMIARVTKAYLRPEFTLGFFASVLNSFSFPRARVRAVHDEQEAITHIIFYLNVIFGSGRNSTFYWTSYFSQMTLLFQRLSSPHRIVKLHLQAKYDVYGPSCLASSEQSPTHDLRTELSLPSIFLLLRKDLGIRYNPFSWSVMSFSAFSRGFQRASWNVAQLEPNSSPKGSSSLRRIS